MSELIKTLKENAAAAITALIVFILVISYLLVAVPRNEKSIDAANSSTMDEFHLQFNNTLKDFANQVDTVVLKKHIAYKAGVCKSNWEQRDNSFLKRKSTKTQKNSAAADSLMAYRFFGNLQSKDSSILKMADDNLIIQSVSIRDVINENNRLIIYKTVRFSYSKFIRRQFRLDDYPELVDTVTEDTSIIPKAVLKKRICGAINFKDWYIYTLNDKKDFLNNNIDPQETDSIKKSPSKLGVLTFKFSEKRFYRKGISIDGTDTHLVLVGAINQEQFLLQARRIDSDTAFSRALLVLLAFICIPMIKPLISSKKEKLTQLDLMGATAGIGVLTVVMVSFCFSNYLAHCYKNYLHTQLVYNNNTVRTNFNNEFSKYLRRLDLKEVSDSLNKPEQRIVHVNMELFNRVNNDPLVSRNIQNYFAFNAKGDIIKDICKPDNYSIRKNYAERDYFKILNDSLHNYRNVLTALYSKYDNKYKLVYVRRSDYKKDQDSLQTVSGFAYVPEFARQFPLNGTMGYMMCFTNGDVFFHSNSDKSLNENIYPNNRAAGALPQVFHGMGANSFFDMNYDGEPCLFFAQRLSSDSLTKVKGTNRDSTYQKPLSDHPVYLLNYLNLGFYNHLDIYVTVNGFVLGLAYALGITLLVLLYSVFFYLGDVPIGSRLHVYWMFPDNSRSKEYAFLGVINVFCFVLFLSLQVTANSHLLYYSALTGINLAFVNFVLLNQRVFFLHGKGKLRTYYLSRLWITVAVAGYLLPLLLWHFNWPSFGFCFSLLGHLNYLYILKKETRKEALPPHDVTVTRSVKSNRPLFIGYFSSVMCYHFLLVPGVLILSLFINEINKVKDYYYSADISRRGEIASSAYERPNESLFNALHLVDPPSTGILRSTPFDSFRHWDLEMTFSSFLSNTQNRQVTLLLVISLLAALVVINRLTNFYAGRFFFFELSEAYRLGYFKVQNKFANFCSIIPPYNNSDLKEMEVNEKFDTDAAADDKADPGERDKEQHVWLESIPRDIVSNDVKLDLIMMHNLKMYKRAYQETWDALSVEEKFVMNDFAADHFVNYKNRDVLMSLMERGYVIADPLTGRLRVMNYGFRNFITYLEENDPESAAVLRSEEKSTKGTFSTWRIPLMIVAVSGLLVMMYVYKDSFNNIVLLGGSIVTAMGLIAKFLNSYKQ